MKGRIITTCRWSNCCRWFCKANAQALLIEGANPRHEHEWAVFREQRVPQDKIIIPGVISSTTNYIEHPLLVAERLCRYADVART